jgi:hypothetical protein
MEIVSQGGIKEQGVRVWSVSPSSKIVSRLSRNRDDLLKTAALAEKDTMRQMALNPGRKKVNLLMNVFNYYHFLSGMDNQD